MYDIDEESEDEDIDVPQFPISLSPSLTLSLSLLESILCKELTPLPRSSSNSNSGSLGQTVKYLSGCKRIREFKRESE